MSGKKTIVKAKQFHGKGFATVDENKVTYEAEAENINVEHIIDEVLKVIPIP